MNDKCECWEERCWESINTPSVPGCPLHNAQIELHFACGTPITDPPTPCFIQEAGVDALESWLHHIQPRLDDPKVAWWYGKVPREHLEYAVAQIRTLQAQLAGAVEVLKRIDGWVEGYAMPTNADWATLDECSRRVTRQVEKTLSNLPALIKGQVLVDEGEHLMRIRINEELRGESETLQTEVEGLRGALEYYADENNWTCAAFEYGQRNVKPKYKDLFSSSDGSNRAKAALAVQKT